MITFYDLPATALVPGMDTGDGDTVLDVDPVVHDGNIHYRVRVDHPDGTSTQETAKIGVDQFIRLGGFPGTEIDGSLRADARNVRIVGE